MTEDVSAGRLYAEVVSDTSGFGRDLRAKINAEIKDLRAKIKAEIDTKGLVGQARAAAKQASAAATVRLKVELDTRGLIGQARAAAKVASESATVRLKAELDARSVVAAAKTAAREATAGAGGGIKLPVGADTKPAEDQSDQFRRRESRKPVTVPFTVDAKSLSKAGSALMQLSKIPAIAGGVYLLASALVEVGGGLFAITSAASTAIGTLAAIPNLIGIIGQGAAVLLIGFSGIGDALKAMQKAEDATTTSSASGAAQARATARAVQSASRARARAARSVEDAQISLADAQRAADETAENGARAVAVARRSLADARENATDRERASIERIADAEWTLARAQESAQDAQQALSRAREDARERLEDLNRELRHSVLDEKAASLQIEEARQKLADALWDPRTSDLQKEAAQLAYDQAVANLEDVKDRNEDLTKETAKANQQGVEGSDQVQQAHDQVRDTLHAQQEAVENLATAQRESAKEQRDSARSIADAQRNLADTIESNAQAAANAQRQIVAAHRGIADAEQNLADAQQNLADAQATAAAGGAKAKTANDELRDSLAKLSPAAQRFAKFLFGLKPQWKSLRNDIQGALLPPLERGIRGALPLLDTLDTGLTDTATRVGGLGEKLGKALGEKTFRRDVGTIMASNNRALTSFGDAGLNVVQILRHLAVAAGPLVERFADWTEKITGAWAEEVKLGRESGKLEAWLDKAGDTAALLGRIIGNVGGALFNMGKAAAPAGRDLLATFEKTTAKWREFTGSDDGQKRMQDFFNATKPATEEFGRLVSNLVLFLTKTGDSGGALTGFLSTLNLILGAVNKLLSIPGAAPFMGWLLTLSGVGGALGLASGMVLRMAGNLGKLAKVTGLQKVADSLLGIDRKAGGASNTIRGKLLGALKSAGRGAVSAGRNLVTEMSHGLQLAGSSAKTTAATIGGKLTGALRAAGTATAAGAKALGRWVLAGARAAASAVAFTARLIAQRVATIASTVASVAARTAAALWTAAQWLLNLAMTANPIGLVVAAIALLVGAFIYAWTHSEKFRQIVTGAFNAVRAVAGIVLAWLVGAVKSTIDFVRDHWKLILAILTGPIGLAVLLITKHWDKIKAAFTAAKNWVVSVFKFAWNAITAVVTWPIDQAARGIESLWDRIKRGFSTIRDWVANNWKKVWNGITAVITGPISLAKSAIAGLFGKNGLQKVFSDAVRILGGVWGGIVSFIKNPIRAVLDLINNWVIDKFNFVSGKLGGPKIDRIDLSGFDNAGKKPPATSFGETGAGHAPGLSTGGPVPGPRRGATADNMVIRATPGEEMIRRWSADRMRQHFPGAMEYINKFGRLPGYAMGGMIKAAGAVMRRIPGYADGGFVRPVAAPYSGAWGRYSGSGKSHPALDFPVPVGTGVHAVMDGVVNAVRSLTTSYGKHVRITHASGIESIYGHLSDMIVNVGQQVSAGQLIGRSGSTGNSTGPHLHLELRRNGTPFDFTSMLLSGKSPSGGGKNALASLVGGLKDKIAGIAGEPLEWLRNQIANPVKAFTAKYGNNKLTGMLAAMPSKLVEAGASRIQRLLSKITDAVNPNAAAAGPVSNEDNRNAVRAEAAKYGWNEGGEWAALDWIVRKESSYNNLAQNPTSTAYGLFQFLDGLWKEYGPKTSDPALQAKYGLQYIKRRYGDPLNARAFHLSHGWYDSGGLIRPGTSVVHNETRKPEAVLTHPQWQDVSGILDALMAMASNVKPADSPGGSDGAAAPLIGNLDLSVGSARDLPEALDLVDFKLRTIKQGGVYARPERPR